MIIKLAIGALALSMLATPALAEFYVIQNTSTMTCSIVEQKPADTSMKMIGSTYSTQADAEAGMKAEASCK